MKKQTLKPIIHVVLKPCLSTIRFLNSCLWRNKVEARIHIVYSKMYSFMQLLTYGSMIRKLLNYTTKLQKCS